MIYFLDFEASSLLPGSFPVEVAWINQDGLGESYLIHPTQEWLANGCPNWSLDSERIHGLSVEFLLAEGKPIGEVAARAAAALSAPDATVYSNAPTYDGGWLDTLLAIGGRGELIQVRDVQEAFGEACRPLHASIDHLPDLRRERMTEHVRALASLTVSRAVEAEALRPRTRHRALPDADSLWRAWRAIGEAVTRTLAKTDLPERVGVLCRAVYRGEIHAVCQAEPSDLASLVGKITGAAVRDEFASWTLVAIRWPRGRIDVHALGWRQLERNVWITSPIEILDRQASLIRTRSRHVYALGEPECQEMRPDLLAHLQYALRTWGYVDVAP